MPVTDSIFVLLKRLYTVPGLSKPSSRVPYSHGRHRAGTEKRLRAFYVIL